MALFDWLKYRFWKNRNRDIPENVFIEKPEDNIPEDNNDTKNTEPMYDLTSSTLGITYNGQLIQGIDSVHLFITIDRDKKGYNDALANSDASNLKDNLNLLDSDLSIVIDRALSFYEEKIEVQDNLIKSRNNFGLNELADEIFKPVAVAVAPLKDMSIPL